VKLQVLQQLNAGVAASDVCRAFGLAVTTVALWRRAYALGGYEALIWMATTGRPSRWR
jgi:transposase-like protein